MRELIKKIIIFYQTKYITNGHEYVTYIDVDDIAERSFSIINKNYDSERGNLDRYADVIRNILITKIISLSSDKSIKSKIERDKKLELLLFN